MSTTGVGVYGQSSGTTTSSIGVYGSGETGGYAGYFAGEVGTRTLSIGGDPPMSHNPHMTFSGFLAGNMGQNCGGDCSVMGGYFVPDEAITITRISAGTQSPGSGCSTPAPIEVQDNNGTFSADLDIGNGVTAVDSGPISYSVPAGDGLYIFGYGAQGCSLGGGSASNVFVNVQYVMQ